MDETIFKVTLHFLTSSSAICLRFASGYFRSNFCESVLENLVLGFHIRSASSWALGSSAEKHLSGFLSRRILAFSNNLSQILLLISSMAGISYAVFCFKKKKIFIIITLPALLDAFSFLMIFAGI